MTIAKDFASKFSVAFVAIAMLLTLVAPAANAQESSEDLQKTIADLLAQVAELEGKMGDEADDSSMSCESIPAPLTMGAENASVKMLQERLIADGEAIAAGATGYFGAQTKAALASWQSKNNVAPAAGYYGPVTKAAMDASCTPADEDEDMDEDDEDMSGDLSGEGTLDMFEIDDAADDSIEEGSEEAEIAELSIEATDGDIEIDRLDIALVGVNTPTESDPWEVFETVSLWVDGDMIAEMTADDEDEYLDEDDGTIRFSGLDLVAMEDEEVEVVIAATVQGDVDGAGTDADWTVSVEEVRYFDADGVADDDSTTDELGDTAAFEIVAEGEGDELTVRTSSEDPSATTIQLEDDKKTDYTTVFAFRLDASDSDGDVEVNEIRVDVAATEDGATGTSTTNLISDAQLVIDGEIYDDVTITHGTTGNFVFDIDGDVVIDAEGEVTVEFQTEFKALATRFEGATIEASAAGSNVDAEGADDIVVDGSATGDEHTLRTSGAILETTDTTETSKANTDGTTADDEGIFKIEFDVTAFENDLYIDDTATRGTVESNTGLNFLMTIGGTATTAGTAVATVDSDAQLDGGRYLVEEGSTESFTLTVEFDPNVTGSYKLQLYSVNFNDTNADADTQQRALPVEDYETGSLTI
jgi:Putative peptidoglycan binding domain